MILALVLPGPTEPDSYEFNQMFEPLIDNIIELAKGELFFVWQWLSNRALGQHMRVHDIRTGRCEQELVHAHLSMALVDHIARLKVCGHAGTGSECNFCVYCKLQRSFISVPKGFKRKRIILFKIHN